MDCFKKMLEIKCALDLSLSNLLNPELHADHGQQLNAVNASAYWSAECFN